MNAQNPAPIDPSPTFSAPVLPSTAPKLTWRAPQLSDLDQIMQLIRDCDEVDPPAWHYQSSDIEHWFTNPDSKFTEDAILGIAEDDRVLALGQAYVSRKTDRERHAYPWGYTHPSIRNRGVGEALFRAEIAHALAIHQALPLDKGVDPDLHITAYVEKGSPSQVQLMEDCGLKATRFFARFNRPLTAADASAPEIPAEVEVLPLAEVDREASLTLRNQAFKEHWGTEPLTLKKWNHMLDNDVECRADLSFVVRDRASGKLHAFALGNTTLRHGESEESGIVEYLGTAEGSRNRGYGSLLLKVAQHKMTQLGFSHVSLDVDVDNTFDAANLYQKLGYDGGVNEIAYTAIIKAGSDELVTS